MPIQPAQLQDVWVERIRFEEDATFDRADTANVSYFVEPKVEIGELRDGDDGSLSSAVRLSAEVRFARDDEIEGALPFELDISVVGSFEWSGETKPADAKLAPAWLDYNAMYLLWPYLRAHIATVTSASRLPTLTIYTMNVPNPPVIPSEDDTSEQAEGATAQTEES
jgi:preprotein translocase subunit SecB